MTLLDMLADALARAQRTGRALMLATVAAPALLLGPARAEAPAVVCATGTSALPALAASHDLERIAKDASRVPNGEGRLFRLSRDGVPPSWLFGTMHMSDPRILDMPEAADHAFEGANRVVIETVDMLNEIKVVGALLLRSDLINLAQNRTLADVLSPGDLATVRGEMEARGIPFNTVERMQPWFLATSFAMPPCELGRKAAGDTVLDLALAQRAQGAGKPVLGLESAEEQLEAIASMPLDVQIDNLVATLAVADEIPDIYETMIALYLQGRIATITPVIEAMVETQGKRAGSAAAYAAFEERVVTNRNTLMAERMQPILKNGGVFVAVGALHLPGEKGLVELLRREGWSVTRAD